MSEKKPGASLARLLNDLDRPFAKGTIGAGGRQFYIDRVDLHLGEIRITARAPGPLAAMTDVPVTVTGPDSHVVCRSAGPALSVPEVAAGEIVQLVVRLSVNVTG